MGFNEFLRTTDFKHNKDFRIQGKVIVKVWWFYFAMCTRKKIKLQLIKKGTLINLVMCTSLALVIIHSFLL